MKVKILTQLKGVEGEPLAFPKQLTAEQFIDSLPENLRLMVIEHYVKIEQKPRLLKDVMITVVIAPDEKDDETAKLQKYGIYKKLFHAKGSELDLSIEELGLIKKYIGKFQPQLVMGQCFEILEGKKDKNDTE